ncbi:DUF6207 family protein [Streptomyces sp. NPDC091204]|uniref:DUF6207 family protein n=1 Tax=Streptomyces sp. NPDC091204 TaxID=3155299 RepID=UPI00342F5FC1
MEQIDPTHVSEHGLLVLDITGRDEATVYAAADDLGRRWATSGTPSIRRVPGEPGVTAPLYADLRRSGDDPGCSIAQLRLGAPCGGWVRA